MDWRCPLTTIDRSPSIDLVVPTIDRPNELRRLLESAVAQGYEPLRVVVIDMNDDDSSAAAVLAEYSDELDIVHLRVSRRGVSKARNFAMGSIEAEVISLSDDDCWLPDGFLHALGERFHREPSLAGLSVMQKDAQLRPSNGRWATRPGRITKTSVWGRGVSAGIFVRASAVREIGGFDEGLGPGSGGWAAGEETDLLIRLVDTGHRVDYEPSLFVHHPDPQRNNALTYPLERWRAYAQSTGHLMRKHRCPPNIVAYHCARPLIGSVAAALRGDFNQSRSRLAVAVGRLEGWARSKPSRTGARPDKRIAP